MGYIGDNPQSYLDFQGAGSQPTHGLELTASSVNFTSQSEIDFTIPDRYELYEFYFINIHPASASRFAFQVNTAAESGWDRPISSTFWYTWHKEDASSAGEGYEGNNDQGVSDGAFQNFTGEDMNTNNDSALSGVFRLFNPSNDTYSKHFLGLTHYFQGDPTSQAAYLAGYVDTTTPLTAIRFKMLSGNMDSGSIYMYGVKA